MTIFLVTAWEYLGLTTSSNIVTSIHQSRLDLFLLHNYFGLYHALTNIYPSRLAIIITRHLSYTARCCPQPPIGHRPQVAASLLSNSNLPTLGRYRTSTRFHSRCVHGHKLSNEFLRVNYMPSCRASTEFDRRYVHGHVLSNELYSGNYTPSLRRYRKATNQSTDTTNRSFATKYHSPNPLVQFSIGWFFFESVIKFNHLLKRYDRMK